MIQNIKCFFCSPKYRFSSKRKEKCICYAYTGKPAKCKHTI